MFEWLLSPEALVALFTLTALEIVLGINQHSCCQITGKTTSTGAYYRVRSGNGNTYPTFINTFLDDATYRAAL